MALHHSLTKPVQGPHDLLLCTHGMVYFMIARTLSKFIVADADMFPISTPGVDAGRPNAPRKQHFTGQGILSSFIIMRNFLAYKSFEIMLHQADPSRELCSQVLQYDERIHTHSG